ncbi:MAG: protein kinase [Myxococcales bacterium]|nr:protein kinase [Myxococcales bacterium]
MNPTGPLRDLVGLEVAGHRVVRRLGEGGFGAVYEAVDLALERPVAMKVMRPEAAPQLARFRDEARLLARINDPHVIQIFQVGSLPDGSPYLTMELFGQPLQRVAPRGHPVAPAEAVRLIAQVLRALAAAHGVGVVHRDIKEANILVDPATGQAKVCDFGIARATEPLEDGAEPTAGIIGTPHYLAPERLRGVRDDPRSDLFAVGVVLYRLLTGRRPFDGAGLAGHALAQRIATEDVAPPAEVPRALARVCVRLLARDADLRPPTAQVALDELLRAVDAAPTAALDGPTAMPAPRRRWALPMLIAGLTLGGVALTVSWKAEPAAAGVADASVEPIAPDAAVERMLASGDVDAAPAPDASTSPEADPPDARATPPPDPAPRGTRARPRPTPKARPRPARPATRAPTAPLDRRPRRPTGDSPFVEPEPPSGP